jgi:RNA polymerase sigma-70 factor (sigma-E family)
VSEADGFREFVEARSAAMLQSAWLLTGHPANAQDLLQTALAKTYLRWTHIKHPDAAEAYVRRVMVTTFISWNRRRWTAERPTGALPESAALHDPYAAAELRADVARALDTLPRRQRAVVVLRYFDDLTEAKVAEALNCSIGTVKSQTARALTALRASGLAELNDERAIP